VAAPLLRARLAGAPMDSTTCFDVQPIIGDQWGHKRFSNDLHQPWVKGNEGQVSEREFYNLLQGMYG